MKRACTIIICYLLSLLGACGTGEDKKDNEAASPIETGLYNVSHGIIDTAAVNALIKEGIARCDANPDSTVYIMKRAIRYCKNIRYTEALCLAYNVLGVAYFNKSDLPNSKAAFLKALEYGHLSPRATAGIPLLYMNLGNVFVRLQKSDSAFYYYRKSLISASYARNPVKLKISIYNGITACFIASLQYDQAIYYADEALKLARQINDKEALVFCYGSIADLYERRNADSSIHYRNKAVAYYRATNNIVKLQASLYSIGKMWVRKEQPDSAQYYFDLSERTLMSHRKDGLSQLFDMGNIYYLRGEYKKALEKYKKAEAGLSQEKTGESYLITYSNLANIYNKLGKNILAYRYQTLYYELKDSLFNEERIAAINHLNMQFKGTEKDKDLLSKQLLISKQSSKIQKQYLGISVSVILILLLLIILYRRRHKTMLISIKAKLAGAEQERLRLAQEIHDGIISKLTSVKMNFNALPDYREEHLSRHFNETLQNLDASITELRHTTHKLHHALLKQVGLLNEVNNYILQVNTGFKIDCKTVISGEFPVLGPVAELHLYRIIQELIQNITKHAEATRATLTINATGSQLIVSLQDNGKGINDVQKTHKNSIGLNSVRDRVQILGGFMEIRSVLSGTLVSLRFSIKNLTEDI